MGVPKRRTSQARQRRRRTHQKLSTVSLIKCENCGETKRPHHVCPSCGYYRGKEEVVVIEDVED